MYERLRQLFSATDFSRDEVTDYAQNLILPETRMGLLSLATLLLALQVGILFLEYRAGRGDSYLYTFVILSLLSCHMIFSSRFIKDTETLHYLAMTYLIIYGTSIALVAHRSGQFEISLMAACVMLIVSIPLVPWGLKEAAAVAILIYTMFTASSVAVAGRFDLETLSTLQFLFVASTAIALSLVARNVRVRKHDIETRFDLEQAQRRHEHLSLTDPLTGAFNRRYLDRYYTTLVAEAQSRDQRVYLALLDIDQFKPLNDTFGHHAGDEILKQLVEILVKNLPGNSVVVRLGGDEFAIVFIGDKVHEIVTQCLKHLATDPAVLRVTQGQPVIVSAGFAIAADEEARELHDVYRAADEQLYIAKGRRNAESPDGGMVTA